MLILFSAWHAACGARVATKWSQVLSDDVMGAEFEEPPGRVLLLEASPTLRLMIASLLRRWGFTVDEHRAPGADYDLMLAAASIGDPALDAARQAARAAGVPWLALLPASGAALSADADGWVQKPIVAEALHHAVRLCLERRSLSHRPDGLDLAAIAALWGTTGNATFLRVSGVFIEEMAQRLSSLAGALAKTDRDLLTIEAHSIGGAAANVGCATLSLASRALEHEAAGAEPRRLASLVGQVQAAAATELAALQALVAEAR